jgi:hypothetical protein
MGKCAPARARKGNKRMAEQEVIDVSTGEIIPYSAGGDIQVSRAPEKVLAEAQQAAAALGKVLSGKEKPVMMNGEKYLEFEDWQTVGRFYGVSTRVVRTQFVEYGGAQGFEAYAEAVRADGAVVSAAESMCMNDEKNWKDKPLFQLRSMAQTRACAKALRGVLAWVVVLAGYKPTPAEEMQGVPGFGEQKHAPMSAPAEKPTPAPSGDGTQPPATHTSTDGDASDAQKKMIWAKMKGLNYGDGEPMHARLTDILGRNITSTKQLNKADIKPIVDALDAEKSAL